MSDIIKIIDKRQRCYAKCVVMRWSNSEVYLRQWKTLIISARDNENSRWNRENKTKSFSSYGFQYTLRHSFVPLFFVLVAFLFHLLLSLSLALIISIFYGLNYTSLFLYLIIAHLVNAFYNSYIINISPRQLLWFI